MRGNKRTIAILVAGLALGLPLNAKAQQPDPEKARTEQPGFKYFAQLYKAGNLKAVGRSHGEAVRGEHLVRDLKRLPEADWPAQAVLVGNVVVRGAQQLNEDL